MRTCIPSISTTRCTSYSLGHCSISSPFRILFDQHNAPILPLENQSCSSVKHSADRFAMHSLLFVSFMQAAPSRCRDAGLVRHSHYRPGPTHAAPLSQLRALASSSRGRSRQDSHRLSLSDYYLALPAQLFVAITVVAGFDSGGIKLMMFVRFSLSSCLPLMTRKYRMSRYVLGYLVRRTLDNTTGGRTRHPLQG